MICTLSGSRVSLVRISDDSEGRFVADDLDIFDLFDVDLLLEQI